MKTGRQKVRPVFRSFNHGIEHEPMRSAELKAQQHLRALLSRLEEEQLYRSLYE